MKKFKAGDIVYLLSTLPLYKAVPYKVDAFLYNDDFEEDHSWNTGDGNVYVLDNMVDIVPKIKAFQWDLDYWKNIGYDVVSLNLERIYKLNQIYTAIK